MGLGPARASGGDLPSARALLIVAVACEPAAGAGAAAVQPRLYSYLAQGTILHLGPQPLPLQPRGAGRARGGHVLDAVSPFWRHTTAPYGPLFLGLVSLIVGRDRVASDRRASLLVRLLELIGSALVAV